MNQEQVRELLLRLDPKADDFTVTFTGKTSRKVDGLYYPDRKEIIIHNKNFTDDSQLVYTAIHEFAHHLHHTRSSSPVPMRSHTNRFWDIFHRLLFLAEEKGVYANIFRTDARFIDLTRKIREEYLSVNGGLMKELGGLLIEAAGLCEACNACFDDYVDRELLLPRSTAKVLMKLREKDIAPGIGYENMKTVARINDEDARADAMRAFINGETPDMVRAEFLARPKNGDELGALLSERDRIENTIGTLTRKLARIERRIQDMKSERTGA